MRTMLPFLLVLAAGSARAQTIDFETFPDGSLPADAADVNTQFGAFGVTFALVQRCTVAGQRDDPRRCLPPTVIANRFPRIAVVGLPLTAFTGVDLGSGCADQPQAAAGAGQRFLTDGGGQGLRGNLWISYAQPVESAAGDVLDVDLRPTGAFEEWTVLALDASFGIVAEAILHAPAGAPLASSCQGGRGPGDGGALRFVLESPRGLREIHHLLVAYTGSTGLVDNMGLAFDNFTPSANLCTPRWESLGAPCRGPEHLGARGCLSPSGSVEFEITGGSPGAHGCLFVSGVRADTPFLGCTIVPGPLLSFSAHVLDAGGSFRRTYAMPPTLAGLEYFLQAVHMGPAGLSFTNGLRGTVLP